MKDKDKPGAGKKVVLFARGMPLELRQRFKAACASQGVSMQFKLAELVRGFVEKSERARRP
jgi:hypothetical protein